MRNQLFTQRTVISSPLHSSSANIQAGRGVLALNDAVLDPIGEDLMQIESAGNAARLQFCDVHSEPEPTRREPLDRGSVMVPIVEVEVADPE